MFAPSYFARRHFPATYFVGAGTAATPTVRTRETYRSAATSWSGSMLEIGDGGSPEAFVAVAEITKFGFGAMGTGKINRTHLLSPHAHVEKRPGMRDTEDFRVEGNWLPQNLTQSNSAITPEGLVYLARKRRVKNMRLVMGNSGSPALVWPFRGYVSNFKVSDAENGTGKRFTASITPSRDIAEDLP